MMTMSEMAADTLGKLLAKDVKRLFGSSRHEHAERFDSIARIALKGLGKKRFEWNPREPALLQPSGCRRRDQGTVCPSVPFAL